MAERYHNGAFEPCAVKQYVSKTIERTGTLPITINADGNALIDYRIYGVSGGVGDRTKNLWNESFEQGVYRSTDGTKLNSTNYVRSAAKVAIDANTEYTFCFATTNPARVGRLISAIFWNSSNEVISSVSETDSKNTTFTTPSGTVAMTVSISLDTQFATVAPADIAYAMVVEGSTAPAEFIPYGYEVDMSVSDGTTSTTTPIYIGSDPLGDDEYVDYGEQKVYRRTDNQFHGDFISGSLAPNGYVMSDIRIVSEKYIKIDALKNTLSITPQIANLETIVFYYNNNKTYIGTSSDASTGWKSLPFTFSASNSTKYVRVVFRYDDNSPISPNVVSNVMLNTGETAKTYIPYLQPTDPPAPLPEIPTADGTTIIDYDGTPKPSQMYVKYNSGSGWEPCTEYVRRNGVWVPQT